METALGSQVAEEEIATGPKVYLSLWLSRDTTDLDFYRSDQPIHLYLQQVPSIHRVPKPCHPRLKGAMGAEQVT